MKKFLFVLLKLTGVSMPVLAETISYNKSDFTLISSAKDEPYQNTYFDFDVE